MSYSVVYAEDFKNLALVMLEDGTTADELKSLIDDCSEEMQNTENKG